MSTSNVNVAVRLRPLDNSLSGPPQSCCSFGNVPLALTYKNPYTGEERSFNFDFAFNSCREAALHHRPLDGQDVVFTELGTSILQDAFDGINCCLFAYGQSRSGKSYSIVGNPTEEGLLPRISQKLLAVPVAASTEVHLSVVELFNEKVFDLLALSAAPRRVRSVQEEAGLRVREHPVSGPYVENLTKAQVSSYAEMEALLSKAQATQASPAASRPSHVLFFLTLRQRFAAAKPPQAAGPGPASKRTSASRLPVLQTSSEGPLSPKSSSPGFTDRTSTITLCDLSGPDKGFVGGSGGPSKAASSNLFKSISCLSRVIGLLSTAKDGASSSFLPYRDSVLTWLLKGKLSGNCRTVMLATIFPAAKYHDVTLATLQFADRARTIACLAVAPPLPEGSASSSLQILRDLTSAIATLQNQREQIVRLLCWRAAASPPDNPSAPPPSAAPAPRLPNPTLPPNDGAPGPSPAPPPNVPAPATARRSPGSGAAAPNLPGLAPDGVGPDGLGLNSSSSEWRLVSGPAVFGAERPAGDQTATPPRRAGSHASSAPSSPMGLELPFQTTGGDLRRSLPGRRASSLSAAAAAKALGQRPAAAAPAGPLPPISPSRSPVLRREPLSPPGGLPDRSPAAVDASPGPLSPTLAPSGFAAAAPASPDLEALLPFASPEEAAQLRAVQADLAAVRHRVLAVFQAMEGGDPSPQATSDTRVPSRELSGTGTPPRPSLPGPPSPPPPPPPVDVAVLGAFRMGLLASLGLAGPGVGPAVGEAPEGPPGGPPPAPPAAGPPDHRGSEAVLKDPEHQGDAVGTDAAAEGSAEDPEEEGAGVRGEPRPAHKTIHHVDPDFAPRDTKAVVASVDEEGRVVLVRKHRGLRQAAAAAASGDEILVAFAVYEEAVVLAADVKLTGQSTAKGQKPIIQARQGPALTVLGGRAMVTGFRVVVDGAGPAAILIQGGDCVLQDCEAWGRGLKAVLHITHDSRATVRRNVIRDGLPRAVGILVTAGACPVVCDNDVFGHGDCGLVVEDARPPPEDGPPATRPLVQRNRFHDGRGGGVALAGRGCAPVLEDNVVCDNQCSGLLVEAGATPTVRRCQVARCQGGGISITGEGTGGLVADSEICENLDRDVFVGDAACPTFEGNTIHHGSGFAMVLCYGASGLYEANAIYGYDDHCVVVRNGASGTFLRNHIRYGPRHAVLVYDQGTGVFEGNVLEGESEELGFTTRSGGAPRIRQNAFRRAKPD